MKRSFYLPVDAKRFLCWITVVAGMIVFVSSIWSQSSTTPPIAIPYTITTVAGSGTGGSSGNGGPATSAQISSDLRGVAVDAQGDIYFTDTGNSEIRKVNAQTGIISLVAGGASESTCTTGYDKAGDGCLAASGTTPTTYLDDPRGIALDKAGNIYIAGYNDQLVHIVYNGGSQAAALITLENPSITSPQIGYMYLIAGDLTGVSGTCTHAYSCASGSGGYSGDGGLATSAALNKPRGMNVDDNGNLWICDTGNNVMREINVKTGIITTVVGSASNSGASGYSGDGSQANSSSVKLDEPTDVVFDSANNAYIVDFGNKVIREVNASTGVIETIVGGSNNAAASTSATAPSWPASATGTGLGSPTKIAIDSYGNLYFADTGESVIYFYDATAQTITPIAGEYGYAGTPGGSYTVCSNNTDSAGDGCPALQALFYQGSSALGVAIDGLNNLYISDPVDERIRKVSTNLNFASTANGGSLAQTVEIHFTVGDTAAAGNGIVVGTSQGDFTASASPSCTTNSDNTANCTTQVKFSPLYPGMRGAPLAVTGAHTHRNFPLTGVGQTALTGVDPGTVSLRGSGLSGPLGAAVDAGGNLYIADTGNNRVVEISAQNQQQTVIAGTGTAGDTGNGGPAAAAELNAPTAVAISAAGYIYIADTGNNVVRVIDPATSDIATFAGGATSVCTSAGDTEGDVCPATQAILSSPSGLAVDLIGNVYIADTGHNLIRRVDQVSGYINLDAGGASTVCSAAADSWGDNCPPLQATFKAPHGLALDASGNLYVADTANNEAREINLGAGTIAAAAGNGVATFSGDNDTATSASLNAPQALAVDGAGDIYIADTGNDAVRVVSASTLDISTLIGTGGTAGLAGGSGPATQLELSSPGGIALDARGDVYASDTANNRALYDNRNLADLAFGNGNDTPPTASLPQTADVSNLGNVTLTFTDSPAYSPSAVTGYTFSTSAANGCQGDGSLTAGSACTLSVIFEPTATQAYNGALTFPSNAVNSVTASIQLSGSGVSLAATTVSLALTSPASGTLQYGETGVVTATVSPASGTGATPAGEIIFSIDGTQQPEVALTSGSATLNINLAVGNHTISAEYLGSATYAANNSSLPITVSKAATTTTLKASPAAAIQGQTAIVLTATVTSIGGTPGGTVSFYSGGTTLLGTVNLSYSQSQDLATLSVNNSAIPLAVGAYQITAEYNGSSNYGSSTSSPPTAVTVEPIPPDFSVAATSATLTVPQGGNVQTILTVTPQGGISGTIALSCTGLPANALCTFYPTTIPLSGTNAQVTTALTIYTNTTPLAQQSRLDPAAAGKTQRALLAAALLPCVLFGFGGWVGFRRRHWSRFLMLMVGALFFSSLLYLSGCTSNATQQAAGVTPTGTSTVNVVLTGPDSVTQTIPITLVVTAGGAL